MPIPLVLVIDLNNARNFPGFKLVSPKVNNDVDWYILRSTSLAYLTYVSATLKGYTENQSDEAFQVIPNDEEMRIVMLGLKAN